MRATTTFRWTLLLACSVFAASLQASPRPGMPAPDFSLTDIGGKPLKLSDYKGKYVVLEWTNPHCPYVAKHYDTGNMQALQQTYAGRSVVWLSIASARPSHSEYASEKDMQLWLAEKKAAPARVMLDKDGTVGHLYDARTTP